MTKYRRLTDGLDRVGKLIPANENPFNYVTDTKKDWYLSVYEYNEDHKKHAEKIVEKKSKKTGKSFKREQGIEGIEDVVTNILVFDVDCKKDLDAARKDCVAICERLDSMGIPFESQNISFSGGKGFSVVVEHDKSLSPSEHINIAKEIAGDLETFDDGVYNASRIFRLNHTKHNSSGLFKTPLTFDEVKTMSIPEIKDIAKQEYDIVPFMKATLPDKVLKLKDVAPKEKKKEKAKHLGEEVQNIDFSKKPYYLSDLKYVLQCGYIPEGKGNEGMMILCATYRHVGIDKIDAYHLLKSVNEKRSNIYEDVERRSNDEIWDEVITTVYSTSWKGGTYTPKESSLLEEIAEKFNIHENCNIVGVKKLEDRFISFVKKVNQNVIKTGIKSLDDTILMTPGMMIGLLAAPSAGKTSIATKIMETQALSGQAPLFLSMDMHDNLLTQRLLQRLTGYDFAKKIRKSIEGDRNHDPDYNIEKDPEVTEAFDKFHEVFGEVDFDFTRGCTIESIEENIRSSKMKHGDKFRLVVVDYLEKVRGPYTDATANSGYVASRLSDLATTYDVAILLLLQPQKSAGDPAEELVSMRKVKGASVIEQDCRVILTMWRPGFNPQNSTDDKFMSMAVVKNNMGPVTQLDLGWDGVRGDVFELNSAERNHLESVIDAKKEEKEEKKKQESNW